MEEVGFQNLDLMLAQQVHQSSTRVCDWRCHFSCDAYPRRHGRRDRARRQRAAAVWLALAKDDWLDLVYGRLLQVVAGVALPGHAKRQDLRVQTTQYAGSRARSKLCRELLGKPCPSTQKMLASLVNK